MLDRIRSYDRGVIAVLAAALLSFAVWILARQLGFDEPPGEPPGEPPRGYETYFQQINWWPHPFVFLGLAPVLWLTWEPMLRAWSQLAETGVLLKSGGEPDDTMVQQVLGAIREKRGSAFFTAFAIALAVNLADWAPRYEIFLGTATLDKQLDYACRHPSSIVKWIFVEDGMDSETACGIRTGQSTLGDEDPGIKPPLEQVAFNAMLMAQQFLIVLFAALAVTQLLLHTLLFAIFERLSIARAHGLTLMLNCRSPLNEFGLERWNYALNNFYWAASPALLGVFLSRASTPQEEYLVGQALLRIAVPVCLIIPMVATVLVRQARLPAAWTTIQRDGPVTPEDYRRQQLWPLDRNWSSKLGIILAFALAAMSIGVELSQLVRL